MVTQEVNLSNCKTLEQAYQGSYITYTCWRKLKRKQLTNKAQVGYHFIVRIIIFDVLYTYQSHRPLRWQIPSRHLETVYPER